MKKKKLFKTKKHGTRLVAQDHPYEAEVIRYMCRKLSLSTRTASLNDRINMRKIISSLLRNAERLEGK